MDDDDGGQEQNSLTLRQWLSEKPFTLTLSSSFFGFYAHTGLLRALIEEGLEPSKLTGSSAGGMIAVAYAAGLSVEAITNQILKLRREEILQLGTLMGNPWPGLFNVYKASQSVIRDFLPVHSFEQCRLPAAVSAFDIYNLRTQAFFSGDIVTAVAASMSVPFMFKPTFINGKPFLDGALFDVAGLAGVDKDERVLYHHCTALPVSCSGIDAFRNSTTLKIEGLPFLDPATYSRRGAETIELAYVATKDALGQRMPSVCTLKKGQPSAASCGHTARESLPSSSHQAGGHSPKPCFDNSVVKEFTSPQTIYVRAPLIGPTAVSSRL